jgi:HD superfamily phosphodiesterase
MTPIDQYIKRAEEKWLNKLFNHCQSLFSDDKLPSHNHTHHARVWKWAKDILIAINKQFKPDFELIESVLVASMFHDTGLTITLNETHGIESRKLCEQYFNQNNLEKPAHFEEICEAIELHDDKNYSQINNSPDSLISILCNADDLDAFGLVGVIRYTEIYLLRGVSINELSKRVIPNLENRFFNFEKTYKKFPVLYKKHKERYLITKRFFEETNSELT